MADAVGTRSFDALVREYLVARRRGGAEVRPAAERLAVALVPRIAGWIKAFRLQGGERVDPDDRADVEQLAFLRVMAAIENQRASEAGRFKAAARTATEHCCRDHLRARLVRDRHSAGSLDEPGGEEADDPRGRYDHVVADRSRTAREDAEQQADAAADVAWAIERIASEDQRAVLRLSLAGMPADEIAERLRFNLGNVYQLRSRAMKRIGEVLRGD